MSDPGHTSIMLRGELCAYSVGELRTPLLDLASRATALRIDLCEVTLLGAAALGLFVELDGVLRRSNGGLLVEHPSDAARRVFALCRLEHLVAPDVHDERRNGAVSPDAVTPPELTVRNRNDGLVVEVSAVVDGSLDAVRGALSDRLVRIIDVRQPNELHLHVEVTRSNGDDGESWDDVRAALERFGGRLVLSASGSSAALDAGSRGR